ncbi:CAP domain-containing protein [Butyrivibrio sp. X503]|nr:CAP domain-containing protein [Butyrivibrio sp. X503]
MDPMLKKEQKILLIKKAAIKGFSTVAIALMLMCAKSVDAHAAGIQTESKFDYRYYADTYPDLKAAFGYDEKALRNHYNTCGKKEGRKCCPDDTAAVQGAVRTKEVGNVVADKNVLDMLAQLNAYRAANGLPALELSQKCVDVAGIRAKECAASFSHNRPNGSDFSAAYSDLGYATQGVGENIGMIWSDAGDPSSKISASMGLFKGSSGHNENMLGANWKYVGFGYYIQGDSIYFVQEFAEK